jgi:glycosyltransferase involved in cell wall biosynthesis
MARITAPMRAATRSAPVPFVGVMGDDVVRQRGEGAAAELRLLVYGRVMRVKGAETVAAAASAIQAALPDGVVLRLVFAGLDWECPLHLRPTSQCVLELLPSDSRPTFLGPLDRSALVHLLPTVHGAVFASEFETFGMAVHELAAAGLPLVVSDIPAFAEFFSPRNAYVFASGNPASLAEAVGALFADLEGGTTRVARLDYADAVVPYERLSVACKQRGGISAAAGDMRLLEAAIARREEECWPAKLAECEE